MENNITVTQARILIAEGIKKRNEWIRALRYPVYAGNEQNKYMVRQFRGTIYCDPLGVLALTAGLPANPEPGTSGRCIVQCNGREYIWRLPADWVADRFFISEDEADLVITTATKISDAGYRDHFVADYVDAIFTKINSGMLTKDVINEGYRRLREGFNITI